MTGQLGWSVNSPLIQALHNYDTEIAIKALSDPPAQKEETTMTAAQIHPRPAPGAVTIFATQAEVEALGRHVGELTEKVDKQARQIAELMELLDTVMSDQGSLEERVTELETTPKVKVQEDVNDLLVAYLRDSIPGVWLTPAALAANLDLDHKSVAGRLERLSRAGGLRGQLVERKGGRGTGASPLYRVVPPPKPPQAEASDGH
jgi:uncharacterized coiled-coil protein SlyX